MSGTPRTDEEMKRTAGMFDRDSEGAWMRMIDLSKELEKELAAARKGYVNIYKAITGKDCDESVALGLATSAVSTVQRELAAANAKVEKLKKVLGDLISHTLWENDGHTFPQQVIAGQSVLKEVEQGNLISKSNTK